MDSKANISILPPEIWIQILSELEWNDLLQLQRVCKAFQSFISTAAIQYKIHLGIAGYNDGPDTHPMTVSERLETLKQTQSAFSRGKFGIKRSIPLSGYTPTYEYQGGVFLQGRHERGALYQTRGVNVFKLPSYVNSTPTHKWKLPNFQTLVRDFTLDPTQDLLVVIENDKDFRVDAPRLLKFLSLTSGGQHPLSSKPVKITQFAQSTRASFVVTVMGDFVGLLTSPTQFYICNWKSGEIIFLRDFNSTDPIHDFFFLNHESFCLVRGRRTPPQVEIYRIFNSNSSSASDSNSNSTEAVIDNAKLTAIYHLPRTPDGVVLTVFCRSDPPGAPPTKLSPTSPLPPVEQKPFFVKMEDRILIFTLRMEDGNTFSYDLVVRAETLINPPPEATPSDSMQDNSPNANHAEAVEVTENGENEQGVAASSRTNPSTGNDEGVIIVKSDMWMRKTRLWPSMTSDRYWVCYCYGSRFTVIAPKTTSLFGSRVKILDFNPRFCDWMRAEEMAERKANGKSGGGKTDTTQDTVPLASSDRCPWESDLEEWDNPGFKPNRRLLGAANITKVGRFIGEEWVSGLPCVLVEPVTTSRLDKFHKVSKRGKRGKIGINSSMMMDNDEEEDIEDVVEVVDAADIVEDDSDEDWEEEGSDAEMGHNIGQDTVDEDDTNDLDAMIDDERLVLVKLRYNRMAGYKEPVALDVFTV